MKLKNLSLIVMLGFTTLATIPVEANHMRGSVRIRASFRERCNSNGCRQVTRIRLVSRSRGCFSRVRATAVFRSGGCSRRMC